MVQTWNSCPRDPWPLCKPKLQAAGGEISNAVSHRAQGKTLQQGRSRAKMLSYHRTGARSLSPGFDVNRQRPYHWKRDNVIERDSNHEMHVHSAEFKPGPKFKDSCHLAGGTPLTREGRAHGEAPFSRHRCRGKVKSYKRNKNIEKNLPHPSLYPKQKEQRNLKPAAYCSSNKTQT